MELIKKFIDAKTPEETKEILKQAGMSQEVLDLMTDKQGRVKRWQSIMSTDQGKTALKTAKDTWLAVDPRNTKLYHDRPFDISRDLNGPATYVPERNQLTVTSTNKKFVRPSEQAPALTRIQRPPEVRMPNYCERGPYC